MKRTYFKITVNSILFSLLSFVTLLVIFNYSLPRGWAVGLAVTLSALVPLLVIKTGLSAHKKSEKKSQSQARMDGVINGLCFLSQQKLLILFRSAYENLGRTAEIKSGAIFLDGKEAVFLRFWFDSLTKTEVVKIFNKLPKSYSAKVFTYSFDEQVKGFSDRFDERIKLFDGKDAFNLLEKAGVLVPATSPLSDEKPKKASLKGFLDRKKAKSFLRFGLFFMFFSFFVPYKLYYILFGTALSLFAIGVMMFTPKTKKD